MMLQKKPVQPLMNVNHDIPSLTQHLKLSSALGLSRSELHHSSHVHGGLSEGQPVDWAHVLHPHLSARLQGLPVKAPGGGSVDGGRDLTLKAGFMRGDDVHVLQVSDHQRRQGCFVHKDEWRQGLRKSLWNLTSSGSSKKSLPHYRTLYLM